MTRARKTASVVAPPADRSPDPRAGGNRGLASADRPAMRRCLRCRNDFLSEGFHNRICIACKGWVQTQPTQEEWRVIE